MRKNLFFILMIALPLMGGAEDLSRTRAGYANQTQDFVTDTLPNGFSCLDYFGCDMFVDRLAFRITSKEERTVELTQLCAAEMYADRWIYRMDTMRIPETVTWHNDVYTVTAIGSWAFCYSEIKSLEIPSTVTTIKSHAFSLIEELEELVIPNSVTIIEDDAFAGTQMYVNAGWPKRVIFPDVVEKFGMGIFAWGKFDNDKQMASFPNNMKVVPENTYYRGYLNEWRDLPESVEVIDKNAFYGNKFKEIRLPSQLREIGDGAFERCNDLKSVTIPSSVQKIGKKAFSGGSDYWESSTRSECTLDTLRMLSETPCESKLKLTKTVLIVPDGTKDVYRKTWKLSDTPIYEASELTGIIPTERTASKELYRYSVDGRRLTSPHKGINIICMDDGTTKKEIVK